MGLCLGGVRDSDRGHWLPAEGAVGMDCISLPADSHPDTHDHLAVADSSIGRCALRHHCGSSSAVPVVLSSGRLTRGSRSQQDYGCCLTARCTAEYAGPMAPAVARRDRRAEYAGQLPGIQQSGQHNLLASQLIRGGMSNMTDQSAAIWRGRFHVKFA